MKNNAELDKLILWKIRLTFFGMANSGVLGFTRHQLTKDA